MKRTEIDKVSIDKIAAPRSVIDLETHIQDNFTLLGYSLSFVFDDIVLAQYLDTVDNETITRGGVLVPLNANIKAWRLGRVILAGPNCRYTKVGDVVCFPNDKGLPVSNINVDDVGVIKHGMFLNEQRLFGICTPEHNECQSRPAKHDPAE